MDSSQANQLRDTFGKIVGCIQQGNAAEAETRYRKAMKLQPNFIPVYINLSDLYQLQGMNDQSIKVLQNAIAHQPESATLQHALGLALVRQGDTSTAMESLKKAMKLDPQTARFGYVYGVALNSTGQAEQALIVLEETHLRHPTERNVLFALATINRDMGNRTEAIKWGEKLLEQNPGDESVHQLLKSLE